MADSDDPVFLPAKEVQDRPTWRKRKDRNTGKSMVVGDDVELPTDRGELRNRALRTAVAIMEDRESMATARVGAIKVVLEATEPKPREYVLKMLDGDEEAFERWLRAELSEIEAKRAA